MNKDLIVFEKEIEEWKNQVLEIQKHADAMEESIEKIDKYMEVIKCCLCRRDQIK